MTHSSLQTAAAWLRDAENLLVFTGAGVSQESGIPTFRDEDGFWREFPPEQFAAWRGLVSTAARRPRQLAKFLHAVVAPIAAARVNSAHAAIAAAEEYLPVTVVTQNIDGLHQLAGSTIVHEVHGSLLETVQRSGRFRSLVSRRELAASAESLKKACTRWFSLARLLLAMRCFAGLNLRGLYHPKLVLFGDAMAEPAWSQSLAAARACDCLLQIGCSGVVLPAAMPPAEAAAAGAKVIAVDPQEAAGDIWLKGTAGEIVPALFEAAFGEA